MFEPCVCVWDTASTYCNISDTLADKWGLEEVGSAISRIGNDEVLTKPLYAITLRLADGSEHMIVAARQHVTGVDNYSRNLYLNRQCTVEDFE